MSVHSCVAESEHTGGISRTRSFGTFRHEFQLKDACMFISEGLGVSQCYCSNYVVYVFFSSSGCDVSR